MKNQTKVKSCIKLFVGTKEGGDDIFVFELIYSRITELLLDDYLDFANWILICGKISLSFRFSNSIIFIISQL